MSKQLKPLADHSISFSGLVCILLQLRTSRRDTQSFRDAHSASTAENMRLRGAVDTLRTELYASQQSTTRIRADAKNKVRCACVCIVVVPQEGRGKRIKKDLRQAVHVNSYYEPECSLRTLFSVVWQQVLRQLNDVK